MRVACTDIGCVLLDECSEIIPALSEFMMPAVGSRFVFLSVKGILYVATVFSLKMFFPIRFWIMRAIPSHGKKREWLTPNDTIMCIPYRLLTSRKVPRNNFDSQLRGLSIQSQHPKI